MLPLTAASVTRSAPMSNTYVRTIRWAHKMHHKHLYKEEGESFGMLLVAKKYWWKVKQDNKLQGK